MRSCCPGASLFASLYGAGSANRFRQHFDAQGVMAVAAVIPNLCDDVDTLDDLERIGLRAGPRTQAALGRWSTREGRAPLGRRRRRSLRVRPRHSCRSGRRDRDRQRRRRPGRPRSRRLARPRQRSSTRSPACTTRSAAGAGRARRGKRSRRSRLSAARTGSGSATAISGSTSCAARLCAPESRSRRSRRASRGLSASRQRSSRQRTIGCAPGSRRRPASFPFQEWFVARGHRDEVDGVRFEGDAAPAPGVLEALAGADAIVIAPSNPYVSIWPILAVEEIRAALVAPPRAVRCGQPARWRPRRQRTGRPYARPDGGRHGSGACRGLLRGPDRRARRRRIRPRARPARVRRVVTQTLMTDLDASRRLAEAVLGAAA